MSDGTVNKALGLMVLVLAIAPSATAEMLRSVVAVKVDSVIAADTNQGFDTRLGPMSQQLEHAFRYSSYRLLSHQESETQCGQPVTFTLPGGRILQVEPRAVQGNMIDLAVVLFQGERPTMSTELQLMNHAMLLLGGPRYKQGMLIISIGADTRSPVLVRPTAKPNFVPPLPQRSDR